MRRLRVFYPSKCLAMGKLRLEITLLKFDDTRQECTPAKLVLLLQQHPALQFVPCKSFVTVGTDRAPWGHPTTSAAGRVGQLSKTVISLWLAWKSPVQKPAKSIFLPSKSLRRMVTPGLFFKVATNSEEKSLRTIKSILGCRAPNKARSELVGRSIELALLARLLVFVGLSTLPKSWLVLVVLTKWHRPSKLPRPVRDLTRSNVGPTVVRPRCRLVSKQIPFIPTADIAKFLWTGTNSNFATSNNTFDIPR